LYKVNNRNGTGDATALESTSVALVKEYVAVPQEVSLDKIWKAKPTWVVAFTNTRGDETIALAKSPVLSAKVFAAADNEKALMKATSPKTAEHRAISSDSPKDRTGY
jgi:hypothetical protein